MLYDNQGRMRAPGCLISNCTPSEDELILEARILLAAKYLARRRVNDWFAALRRGPAAARATLCAEEASERRRLIGLAHAVMQSANTLSLKKGETP